MATIVRAAREETALEEKTEKQMRWRLAQVCSDNGDVENKFAAQVGARCLGTSYAGDAGVHKILR